MDKELDAQTAERINALAKSFKDLHLATTTEEAYARAKEIILGTKKEQAADFTMEQTIGELMQDEIEQKKKQEEIKKAVGDLEVYESQEKVEAKEVEEELAEVEKELSADEREAGEIEEVVEEAEKAEKVSEESSD